MDEGASSSNSTTITTTNHRYWCHRCTNFVQPTLDAPEIQCPNCQSGFIEEIAAEPHEALNASELLAPLLLNLIHDNSQPAQPPPQLLLPLLQNMSNRRGRRGNRVLVFQDREGSPPLGISLNDYFGGPGLEMLLEYISESGPSQNPNPPAKKEEVEKMARVKIEEITSCPVCMEEFAVGEEVRQMPCNHSFHQECILSWLEMHSTCPVCRYQMPVEEVKEQEEGNTEDRERNEAERIWRTEHRRNRERENQRNGEEAESSRSGGGGESPRSRRRFSGLFQRIMHRLRNNRNNNDNHNRGDNNNNG
ncbi:hypothetical protein LUZ60_013193 [Juncus effusus]|nr:hypothetical protein LUZ60_013193 [Juncus effusus]